MILDRVVKILDRVSKPVYLIVLNYKSSCLGVVLWAVIVDLNLKVTLTRMGQINTLTLYVVCSDVVHVFARKKTQS